MPTTTIPLSLGNTDAALCADQGPLGTHRYTCPREWNHQCAPKLTHSRAWFSRHFQKRSSTCVNGREPWLAAVYVLLFSKTPVCFLYEFWLWGHLRLRMKRPLEVNVGSGGILQCWWWHYPATCCNFRPHHVASSMVENRPLIMLAVYFSVREGWAFFFFSEEWKTVGLSHPSPLPQIRFFRTMVLAVLKLTSLKKNIQGPVLLPALDYSL